MVSHPAAGICDKLVPVSVLDEARPVLLRLALTSTVGAGRVTPRSGLAPTGARPSGTVHVAERYASLIAGAGSERDARRWLDEARAELQSVLRRPFAGVSESDRRELELRIVSEGVGMTAVEVAVMCRCTVTVVRRARLGAERDPERGKSLAGVTRERWVRELRASGYSLRQCEALTGIPRSTIADREQRI